MTADAVRYLPEMFSYDEIKLVTAKISDPAKMAEDIMKALGSMPDDEFFANELVDIHGTGNKLKLEFKKGYAGYNISRVEVAVTKIVNGVAAGGVLNKSIKREDLTAVTEGTVGVNTGKEIEAEVRNAQFENIDPYGVHFGGNDQHVDVRGLYNSYQFSTLTDQEQGWEPHAGLGYGDANTETTYIPRDYIIYALQGSSADTVLDAWAS